MHQTTVLISFAVLLCGPCVVADSETPAAIQFGVPAQIEGQITASGTRLVLFFSNEEPVSMNVEPPNEIALSNYSYSTAELEIEPVLGYSQFDTGLRITESVVSSNMNLLLGRVPSSLVIEAEAILLEYTSSQGKISIAEEARDLGVIGRADLARQNPFWYRSLEMEAPEVVISDGGRVASLDLSASGITFMQWFGAEVTCEQLPCPAGGGRDAQGFSQADRNLAHVNYDYIHAKGELGGISVQGMAVEALILAGESPFAKINGSARLPRVGGMGACSSCSSNQTLALDGVIVLNQMAAASQGRLTATLGGQLMAARLDEEVIDPQRLLAGHIAIVASAVLSAAAVLKWLIAPFFTRLSKDQALEHPRRKAIFEYVQQHPGANFREVARNTGIAAGTVRHHLNVLGRSDILVEHQHGSTVRLFENQARFQQNWADLVLLREPPLGQLHAWLKEHPASPQKAVLEGMDAHGWSRSTTQHRLARLVEGGLATIRLQGRLKIYSVVDRNATPPPNLLQRPQPGVAGTPARPGFNTA